MSEPTKDEINKVLGEFMGLEPGLYMRPQSEGGDMFDSYPDYCSPNSPRRLLDEVVAKWCENGNRQGNFITQIDNYVVGLKGYGLALVTIARLTPEQISTAIYNCITEAANETR